MKWVGAGDPAVIYAFARGIDSTSTSTYDNGAAVTTYVDFLNCSTGKGDIYSFTDP